MPAVAEDLGGAAAGVVDAEAEEVGVAARATRVRIGHRGGER